ncbi:MAG: hydrophobic/amphiphilic exporter (mainly bacteria), family [Thermoanaerobaculia bacterium]|jgi:HAE1 family hydrophobic/amphiphilic exporter-1|nr:hydrophobic/amphiphilic exporter (mainly bacteria), family [Thermoanaerobaculia bacterium]
MALSLVILAATVWLYRTVPKGFIPSEDTGDVRISLQAQQGIAFRDMVRHQRAAMDIVSKDPDVQSVLSLVNSGNTSTILLRLNPMPPRTTSVDQTMARLRPKLNAIPGITASLQNPPPIRVGGRQSASPYQYTLQGPDTQALYTASQALVARMKTLPGLIDVNTDLLISNPTLAINVDRERAASLGLTEQQIDDALSSAYAARQISTIYAPNNTYYVIMELQPEFQENPEALSMLYVRASSGTLVPISTVAKITKALGPLVVNHSGQLPSVTISFNTKSGYSLSQAVIDVTAASRATLPSTVTTSFQGNAQAFQSSLGSLALLLSVAVLVIYVVLGILYESFVHPLTILSALPFAGFGALLTLLLFHVDLSIYAFVGIIMLVGLVKKNGIMLVDFAVEAQKSGTPAEEAIYHACVVRFRPIMMTTMAALMGTLPIALGFGAGSESRRPLGLAVVGGLLFSQTLTLFVTPVFYLYMEKLRGRNRTPVANQLPELGAAYGAQ